MANLDVSWANWGCRDGALYLYWYACSADARSGVACVNPAEHVAHGRSERKVQPLAILPTNVKQQVEEMFSQIGDPIKMILVDEGGKSELDQLLSELDALSPKLSYHRATTSDIARYGLEEESLPSILLEGPEGLSRARFTGAPAGHEFGVLVQDIIDLSQGKIELSEATKRYLESLTEDVHLQVFTTPT